VPVSSAEVAEAAKLLENIYRAVNIAMVNEMKTMLTAMDIDVWEVIDAASTKPFGFQPFQPGPGLGGHCIPIDPFYLAWKADQVGMPARFIALAGEVNHAMPGYVVGRAREALLERGVELAGARILILGLAYKPDIDDVRESPSFALIERFTGLGAEVDYHDPHVEQTRPQWHPGRPVMHSVTAVMDDDAALASYDAVVIATHHGAYDYQRLGRVARLIVDTRGAMRGLGGDNVVTA
jgi:UDP-N-acetyl-D-glucosamine dehydrogenase